MKRVWRGPQFRIWLAVIGAATIVLAAAYAMVQQSTRLAANDMPATTAELIKRDLESGANPAEVVPPVKTKLGSDSSVFAVITDESQHVVASSAELSGQTPLPPKNVFEQVKKEGSDTFTWQPNSNIRMATVVVPYNSDQQKGFVITGQSLEPVEERVKTYTVLALAAWVAMVAWASLALMMPPVEKK